MDVGISCILSARMRLKPNSEETLTNTHNSLIVAETRVDSLQLPLSICYCFRVIAAYWSYYRFLTGVAQVPLDNALVLCTLRENRHKMIHR